MVFETMTSANWDTGARYCFVAKYTAVEAHKKTTTAKCTMVPGCNTCCRGLEQRKELYSRMELVSSSKQNFLVLAVMLVWLVL